jgi:hypothetical protein
VNWRVVLQFGAFLNSFCHGVFVVLYFLLEARGQVATLLLFLSSPSPISCNYHVQ